MILIIIDVLDHIDNNLNYISIIKVRINDS